MKKILISVVSIVCAISALIFFDKTQTQRQQFVKRDLFIGNSFTATVADAMCMSQYTVITSATVGVSISTTNCMLDLSEFFQTEYPNVPFHTISYDGQALTNHIMYIPTLPLVATFRANVGVNCFNKDVSAAERNASQPPPYYAMDIPSSISLATSSVDGYFVSGLSTGTKSAYSHTIGVINIARTAKATGHFIILLSRYTDSTWGMSANEIQHDVVCVDFPDTGTPDTFTLTTDNGSGYAGGFPFSVYGKIFYVP